MTEMHERLWREWYDLWHETDASASKPSYEDWLEARIEELGKYARHKASCPVSLAWGKGPGGTGIECDCGFAALAVKKPPR